MTNPPDRITVESRADTAEARLARMQAALERLKASPLAQPVSEYGLGFSRALAELETALTPAPAPEDQ